MSQERSRSASTNRNGLDSRVGFEPTVEFPLHTLSKRAPSTTRTSLRVSGANSLARGVAGALMMGEKVRPHQWIADLPDSTINEVVMDVDARREHEWIVGRPRVFLDT